MFHDITNEEFEKKCFSVSKRLLKVLSNNRIEVVMACLGVVTGKFCLDLNNQNKEQAIETVKMLYDTTESAIKDGVIDNFGTGKMVPLHE